MKPRQVAGCFVLVTLAALVHGLRLERCSEPLGMESGSIPDQDISVSSSHDSSFVGARHSRLNVDRGGGAWCPRGMATRAAEEWLQVDLHSLHVVTGVRTQGRFGHGQGQEYAETFFVDYQRPGVTRWLRWRDRHSNQRLAGNADTNTVVERPLQPPVLASRVRVVPYSDHMRTVCMRVELLGCRYSEGLLSYSMIQGSPGFKDRVYDGREQSNHLSGGLGQLTDGRKAADLAAGLEIAQDHEWVGWKNDTPDLEGRPLEIVFEFDNVRNFSAMHLHVNNQFSKGVQVFSHAKVYLSVFDSQRLEPVVFSYVADQLMEHSRDVTIKLHQRLGRFLRLHLYFAASWLLLSEVSFDSVAVSGNFNFSQLEAPLPEETPQRDMVQYSAATAQSPVALPPPTASPPPRPVESQGDAGTPAYIGPVIGALSAVIVLLAAAIFFIVLRHRRLKGAAPTALPAPDDKNLHMRANVNANGRVYDQVSLHESDSSKLAAARQDPQFLNLYSANEARRRYSSGVPDVVSREYAVPHVSHSHTPPVARRLLYPEPPPIPPPPDQYYPASDTWKEPPSSPPPLPPLPVAGPDELTTATEDADDDEDDDDDDDGEADEDEPLLPEFPREQLVVLERLGVGQYGEINLCKIHNQREIKENTFSYDLIAVKVLRVGASETKRQDFEREARVLARLRDVNIVQLLGVCFKSEPWCLMFEYSPCGDLNQYLQDHVADTSASHLPKTLSFGCLIYMATQIASAMKYLESLKIVHRDLATRNCLVGYNHHIKVSYFGMSRSPYAADYYKLEDWAMLPIRWMAWESVLLGKFTSKSDVWSFAVTLWEILTFAREQPFEELSDNKVIENLTHFYENDGNQMLLPSPINCPREIYDLIRECWQRNESDRPNFQEIYLFLQRKNLGYKAEMN